MQDSYFQKAESAEQLVRKAKLLARKVTLEDLADIPDATPRKGRKSYSAQELAEAGIEQSEYVDPPVSFPVLLAECGSISVAP